MATMRPPSGVAATALAAARPTASEPVLDFTMRELRNRLAPTKVLPVGAPGVSDPAWSEAGLGVSVREGELKSLTPDFY